MSCALVGSQHKQRGEMRNLKEGGVGNEPEDRRESTFKKPCSKRAGNEGMKDKTESKNLSRRKEGQEQKTGEIDKGKGNDHEPSVYLFSSSLKCERAWREGGGTAGDGENTKTRKTGKDMERYTKRGKHFRIGNGNSHSTLGERSRKD